MCISSVTVPGPGAGGGGGGGGGTIQPSVPEVAFENLATMLFASTPPVHDPHVHISVCEEACIALFRYLIYPLIINRSKTNLPSFS